MHLVTFHSTGGSMLEAIVPEWTGGPFANEEDAERYIDDVIDALPDEWDDYYVVQVHKAPFANGTNPQLAIDHMTQ